MLTDPAHPARALDAPGLHPVAYWTAVAVLLAAVAALVWLTWRAAAALRAPSGRKDRYRDDGFATPRDLTRTASTRMLHRRAKDLRPSLDKPAPADVGYLLGHAHGHGVWASVEDSMLILGPPRSGKGLHLVINAVLDAPGAVVTTSTRPDTLAVTLKARERIGPVAVFDPQGLAAGLPAGMRWSPITGCHIPKRALVRALGLAKETGLGGKGVENSSFWQGTTTGVLQGLLHAAALADRTPKDLYVWSLSATAAREAVDILHAHPGSAPGWAEGLDAMVSGDPRTRDNIWMGVQRALGCLADPDILAAVTPDPGETFDPATFLRQKGTLYLLATSTGSTTCGPLVAALIEDITETARTLAAPMPRQRLDPPLLLALDEIGNLTPLPSLRFLMGDGGGTGFTTIPVFQSLAQAREQWGTDQATAIFDSAIVKIILGGITNATDLRELSTPLGERDEVTDTYTIGDHGTRSLQRSIRRVPVMPPEAIRTIPFGTGLVLLRAAPPVVPVLRPWTARDDADQLIADRDQIEGLMRGTGTPLSTTHGAPHAADDAP